MSVSTVLSCIVYLFRAVNTLICVAVRTTWIRTLCGLSFQSKQSVGGTLEWPTGSLLVKVNLSSPSQVGRVRCQRNGRRPW